MFQEISVTDNVIYTMQTKALHGLNNLIRLILKRCHLREMPPVVASVKRTLQMLNVKDNNITTIQQYYFDGFEDLRYLILSKNKLKIFPNIHPISGVLKDLLVTSNFITEIPPTLSKQLFPSLKMISLARNRIADIPLGIFSRLPSLYAFDIQRNKLSTFKLPDFFVYNVTDELLLNLGGNPWRCDSALAWLADLDTGVIKLFGSSGLFPRLGRIWFLSYKMVCCHGPTQHAGKCIFDMSKFCSMFYVDMYFSIPCTWLPVKVILCEWRPVAPFTNFNFNPSMDK